MEEIKINPIFKQRTYDIMKEHITMLNNNENKYNYLLLGDSLFEHFTEQNGGLEFYKYIGKYNIFNAGVGGDKIENVLYRIIEGKLLDSTSFLNLSDIFILVGTNNLNNKKQEMSKKIIIKGIYEIIQHIKIKLNIKLNIYILKIPPRTDIKIGLINDINRLLNMMVGNYKDEKIKMYFIDWTAEFYNTETENINKEYYFDHVHLNELGYKILSKNLILYLDQILNQNKLNK